MHVTTPLLAAVLFVGTAVAAQERREPRWEFDISGRGGWTRAHAAEDVTFAAFVGDERITVAAEDELSSWGLGGGLGARVMRGRFGVEAAWQRTRTSTLVPFVANAEALGVEGAELAREEVNADLLVGQLVFRAAVGGPYSVFAGLGVGRLRVEDPVTADFEAATDAVTNPGELLPALQPEVISDEASLVAGGSIGVTARTGRFFIRQRFEAWFGGKSAATYRVSLPSTFLTPEIGVEAESRLRPTLVMFSVDIGFSLR